MENLSILILTTFLVILLQFAFFSASEQPAYVPIENITLNCGSPSGDYGFDDRFWEGENGSKNGPSEDITANGYDADNKQIFPGVPYTTARVSTSEFNYSFPVSPGQKFVRLHFYPASYNNFDRSKSFFSVKAGSFTLLKNFSAYLVAESLRNGVKYKYFFREFCLNIAENQPVLDLIFAPTLSAPNDTYAFINGIEIVSMPTNLYYTPLKLSEGVTFVDQNNYPSSVDNYTALENVYRLNVGGYYIYPNEDTGMFRTWSYDDPYLRALGVITANNSPTLHYTKIPRYTAPDVVYDTALTLGSDRTYNLNHNLTWGLPVDSGFLYLVRLHFCELQDVVNSQGMRAFRIFLNGQMAESRADIIAWTEDSRVPTYRDYVVSLLNKGKKNQKNITLELQALDVEYLDVMLNGIEVFKLNDSGGSLAGPNPELSVFPPPPAGPSNSTGGKSKGTRRLMVIVGVGCAVVSLIMLSLVTRMLFWRHRKKKRYGSYSKKSWFWPWITPTKQKSTLPEELCRHFSLEEIIEATNNFNDDIVIGKGGFGKVYKGFLDEGVKVVAIKRLNPESRQGVNEFVTEIEMLSRLRHMHLVSLIGYCYENREMILVYDFMSNGTLSDHLYGTDFDPLTWTRRLEICKGAAIGLSYLHTEVNHTVIHRDVKTSNILIDDKFIAKVSDFGLSKIDPKDHMLNTAVKGTWGYLDPEYARGHALTEKSDVYSFGVVLFEVLCARKALDKKLPEGQVNLAHWARKCIADGTLYQVIDQYLIGKIAPECFKVFVQIAEKCIEEVGANRPSMYDVMEKLRFAMELQETADLEKSKTDPKGEHSYPDMVFPVARDMDFDEESELGSEVGLDSSVFSGIGMLESNATGISYPTIDSGSS